MSSSMITSHFKRYGKGYVDTRTGEIYAGRVIVSFVSKGFRIYEHVLSDIARARPLSGGSARIFLYLLGVVRAHNFIPGPSEVAQTLGLKKQNVSRSYQEMLGDGYLLKNAKGYRIYPFICWTGSEAQREDDLSKLLTLIPTLNSKPRPPAKPYPLPLLNQ